MNTIKVSDKYSFELLFKKDYYKRGDTIVTPNNTKLRVVSIPNYSKWWRILLYYMTFQQFFHPKYTYTVKHIKNE